MNDYWVDGHYVSAEHDDDARAWVRAPYGHEPEDVRPMCDHCDQPATSEWDHHDVTVTTCDDCHPDDEEN